jgi:hypothetical protein
MKPVLAAAFLWTVALGISSWTLPAYPAQCERDIIHHPNDNSTVTVVGNQPILSYTEVKLVIPNQVLDIQFRDGQWRDPIKDCK